MMKVNLISLGCPKNLVDSEVILGKLGEAGYALTSLSKDADIIIINTCSFIDKARSESYEVISRLACQKGPSQKLIICGCLPQLEKRKLFLKYPQVDALLGSADFYKIEKVTRQLLNGESHLFSVNEPRFLYDSSFPRLL
ncbi:30S ribosomal protein S12 methylthiotransferase RimO, partial [Candidatus Aerophobetes bacterium]|nr:30S ribosomal protein S12 methylthiotransferase RimO [Candidatus Aerophobetes bacterium]